MTSEVDTYPKMPSLTYVIIYNIFLNAWNLLNGPKDLYFTCIMIWQVLFLIFESSVGWKGVLSHI